MADIRNRSRRSGTSPADMPHGAMSPRLEVSLSCAPRVPPESEQIALLHLVVPVHKARRFLPGDKLVAFDLTCVSIQIHDRYGFARVEESCLPDLVVPRPGGVVLAHVHPAG